MLNEQWRLLQSPLSCHYLFNMNFKGIVKPNKRLGTKFGYPTANIEIENKKLDGLFVGYTIIKSSEQKNLPSIIFIGVAETVNETHHRLESHILDFKYKDLYGQQIEVEIIKKLRDNKKFENVDELIAQMKQDEINARKFFKEYNN